MFAPRRSKDISSCLELWGKAVSMKFFASMSSFTLAEKKAVLEIVEWMGQPDCDSIYECESHEDCIKVVCCLPYILGFSSQEGKIPCTIMDLRKPILVMALSGDFLSCLKKNLSSHPVDRGMPYLQCLGVVSALQLKQGMYYKTLVIRTSADIKKVNTKSVGKFDIVLSGIDQCSKLPTGGFAVVFVVGYPTLPAKEFQDINSKFSSHTKVILFTGNPSLSSVEACASQLTPSQSGGSIISGRSRQQRGRENAMPMLAKYAHIVSSSLIQSFLSKLQLDTANKIVIQLSETHCANVPVVASMSSETSSMEVLCYLPYFLGQSCKFLDIDLNKPILVLAPNPLCWELLRKNLCIDPYIVSNGHLSQKGVVKEALYSTYLVEDIFSTATVVRVARNHEIILAPCTYCQSLPEDCFSIVVVFGSHYLTPTAKINIIRSFQELKRVFFKTDPSNVGVVTKEDSQVVAMWQALSDSHPVPRLVLHGPHVKEKYFSEEKSLLTRAQLVALNSLVNLFMFNASESAVVDSQLALKEVAEVICCLPFMFGWAVSTGTILDTSVDLRLPFLVLGDEEMVKSLWGVVCVKPFFVPSDHVFASETYSDTLYSSYLVKDRESARDIQKVIGVGDDVAMSDIGYMDELPGDCFSVVVVANKGSLQEMLMNKILAKFGEHSKLIFINVLSCREESEGPSSGSQLFLPSVLLEFGEQVKGWLFAKCFSLSIHEIAILKTCVDWMAQPETKNLPLLIEAGPNFTNMSPVLGVLPYMLGWAVRACIIPSSEVDLLHKSILVFASGRTIMKYLESIFFYPFLVKTGLLTPEFVQKGAYYRVKVLEEEDIFNAVSLTSDFDILLCDLEHFFKFSREFASAVFVVSPTYLKSSFQKVLSEWFVPHTKLAFITLVPVIDHFVILKEAVSLRDCVKIPKVSSHSLIVELSENVLAGKSRTKELPEEVQEKEGESSENVDSRLHSSASQSSLQEVRWMLSKLRILDKEGIFEKYIRDSFRYHRASLPNQSSFAQTDLSEIPTTDSACQTSGRNRRNTTLAGSTLAGVGNLNESQLTSELVNHLPKVGNKTMGSETMSIYSRALSKEMTLSDLLDEMMTMPSDNDHHKRKRKPFLRKRRVSEILVPETIRKMISALKNRHKSHQIQAEDKNSEVSFSAEGISHEITVRNSSEKASVEDASLQVLGNENEDGQTVFEDNFHVEERKETGKGIIPASDSVHDQVEDTAEESSPAIIAPRANSNLRDKEPMGELAAEPPEKDFAEDFIRDKSEMFCNRDTGGSQPEKSEESSDSPSIYKC